MNALLETDVLYGVYELYNLTKDADEVDTSSGDADSTPPEIEQLWDRFGPLFQEHHIYVKISKRAFEASALEYLGHIISRRGVEVDSKKAAAVRDWLVPKTQRQ
ncbi:hypothetical protein Tco_1443338, partial [Tanacetum coccineum]